MVETDHSCQIFTIFNSNNKEIQYLNPKVEMVDGNVVITFDGGKIIIE